jgi:hypothetical protein
MNKNKKGQYIGFFLAIFIFCSIFVVVTYYQFKQLTDYKAMNESYTNLKQVIYFESLELENSGDVTDIYDYYTMASEAYDYSDYNSVITYCEQSRKYSSKYSQKLRDIKAEYPTENTLEILEVRKQMIETEIEYLFSLYESCEYLESASRAYNKGDYIMGNANIDGQNEAIREHDASVEEYSNLNSKYNKLRLALVSE